MKNWREFFKGKKVTVMGLGLLGRGVGDAAFLAKWGAEVLVTDLKTEKELAPSLKKLRKFKNIRYILGQHRKEDFLGRDFILKAAGVPLDSPFIAEARKNKVPVEMDASLFFKLMPEAVTFIGVTGTRGKTTTAYLIYEILRRLNLADKKGSTFKTFLAGNIKDTATLPLLEKVNPPAGGGDFVVAELDSWQLQGFCDSKISPHIAVFTSFYPDHLNYYKGDMKKYFADKANIFKYQKKDNFLIVGENVRLTMSLSKPEGNIVRARAAAIPKNWKLKILGRHNRANAACALAVARALKIPDEISQKAIENFRGVPGRLKLLRTIHGVKIYNDTCATTPEATIAALRALGETRRHGVSTSRVDTPCQKIVLIFGGSDKGLDMTELLKEISKHCKKAILLPGSGSEKLPMLKVGNLKEAVRQAIASAEKGDTILFSPAFASFGPPPGGFKNEYDRGEQFVSLVRKLR